jgi:hypothetical protein
MDVHCLCVDFERYLPAGVPTLSAWDAHRALTSRTGLSWGDVKHAYRKHTKQKQLSEIKRKVRETKEARALELYKEHGSLRKVGNIMKMSHFWVYKAIQKQLDK